MASHRIPFESLSAAERTRLIADNDRLRQQLRDRHRQADFAGESAAICRVRDLIAQVAPSAHSVCLQGEEGVGKSRAARAIHAASSRASGPFVTVNCSSLPDTDVDTQLFGVDPATTAAGRRVNGCVGRAEAGTLFFDDVAELGPYAQRRLLRLARDGAWLLPDNVCVSVDVRVIVATIRDLTHQSTSDSAGSSLWGHLNTMVIPLPPLRERKKDLPVLCDLFVEQFARDHVRGVRGVSTRAMDMLTNYDWPGNVGQLQRTIERTVVLTSGPVIHHHHLPVEIQSSGDSALAPMMGLSEALDSYEKELLKDALRQARGVRSQAARLLMTSERVFSYRLRKHGIDARRFKPS
jgi:Nif-specific regulatory protein